MPRIPPTLLGHPVNLARFALAMLLLAASGSRAAAHADYERAVLTLSDADGRTFTVFRHYTDGIIGNDPVRLEVRDPAGQTVAQTDFERDMAIWTAGDGTVYAFSVGLFDQVFWRGWVIEPGRLVAVPTTPRMIALAALAHLAGGWLGYGFMVSLCVAGVLHYVRRAREKRTWRAKLPATTSWAFIWLMLVFLYGPLSLLLIAGLTAVITVPVALVSRSPSIPGRG